MIIIDYVLAKECKKKKPITFVINAENAEGCLMKKGSWLMMVGLMKKIVLINYILDIFVIGALIYDAVNGIITVGELLIIIMLIRICYAMGSRK